MIWSRVAVAVDIAVVGLLAAWGQLQVWSQPDPAWQGGVAVHAVLVALVTLPLLVRRRFPLPVVGVVTAATWLQYELGGGLGQPVFAVVLALYAVAAHSRLRAAAAGGVLVTAGVLAVDVPRLVQGDPLDDVLPAWFLLAGVWAFGRWVRRRGAETRALRAETARLERDREERARAAVTDERARIARELHDLVAHSMGIIVLQAQGAQRVLDRDRESAVAALVSIERTGREGLSEMRRLLGILRHDDERDPLAPPPGIDQLDALVAQVRAAGLPVQLCVEGCPRPLPPGLGLSAYRIVQEALTNTLTHAGPARADVLLRYTGAGVDIEVCDDGAGTGGGGTGRGGGHGLVGMRERVTLFGGTLQAGTRETGGFRVRAHLPSQPEPS